MSVGDKELRVIERSTLELDPGVGQRLHKGDQRVYLGIRKAERRDVRVFFRIVEVATAVVKLDDLRQVSGAAVVKVRPGQLDVAKRRGLEGTVYCGAFTGKVRRSGGATGRVERYFKGTGVDIEPVNFLPARVLPGKR